MDLRPALDGYYGIPQEARLLFSALGGLQAIELSGLLQMSKRITRGGVSPKQLISNAERVHRFSRTVVSLKGNTAVDWKGGAAEFIEGVLAAWRLRLETFLRFSPIRLRAFETRYFEDFVWQQLFARSVPATERARVLQSNHWICPSPWRWMHAAGIERATLFKSSRYPRIDTQGMDVFVAQTPYPGRVSKGTALVVHYHDAIPILMPHTISDRAFHQASHFHAMAANVRDGAYFVCVSEATRKDLLALFPEAEPRAVTIHNMLPSHYFPSEPEPDRVPGIVRRYLHGDFLPKGKSGIARQPYVLARRFGSEEEKTAFYARALGSGSRFLLMVSTLEPRKNHMRLLEAWQALRDSTDPELKLVLVGHIGWDYQEALAACIPGIEQGSLFMLQGVPADALRILYRQAAVTICPSVGEGFDFSGAEAMRCGGVVAASDIPVHNEVYGEAAEFFDPYDTASVVRALCHLMYEPGADQRREALRTAGLEHSVRYLPEHIVPQWEAFLQRAAEEARAARH